MLKYKVFEADTTKGYNFPFILVYPDKVDSMVKIFVEGNNSVDYEQPGQQSFEAQRQYAIKYAQDMTIPQDGSRFNMPYLYQQLNQPVVIPIIERCDNEHEGEFYTQMLGANVVRQQTGKFAKLSNQVVNMVNTVKQMYQEQGYHVQNKSGLIGMSASGVFAGRMLFAEPESFDTCLSVCSNAVQPLPINGMYGLDLPYPLGAIDYEQLFGRPFSIQDYRQAKQLFIVGKDEPNEKYNITKNPRLHDPDTQELYIKAYGDVTLQERQLKIDEIMQLCGFSNTKCVVADGGHSLDNKGTLIMEWARSISATPTTTQNQ